MKNTVLLVDANVLITFLTKREDPFLDESEKVVEMCSSGIYDGYIAFHTLSILWYVLRKRGNTERRKCLKAVCRIFNVVSTSQEEIIDAIEKDTFYAFEPTLPLLSFLVFIVIILSFLFFQIHFFPIS